VDALYKLTLAAAARRIRDGTLSPVDLLDAHLDRIRSVEPYVRAWVSLDRTRAREVAERRSAEIKAGHIRGVLHGIPVGVKDLYHVAGMVTAAGAAQFAHEHPDADAQAIMRLRSAGAIVLGKTTTTEFACDDPTETRNPWNLEHTPGGSSSGSAAAVGAGMLSLALGTQTVGSTLRPAGYCGVIGFKPTYGRISCTGLVPLAWSFDHVGIFCRSVEDVALVLQILAGHDPTDPISLAEPVPDYAAALMQDTPPLRLGIPRHFMERATAEVVVHLESVSEQFSRAGAHVEDVRLPGTLFELDAAGMLVVEAEAATYHAARFAGHPTEYQEKTRAFLDTGMKIPAIDYVAALRTCRLFRREIAKIMTEFDALLMPVAGAPAPKGLSSTGDPTFCAPWSYAGLPAIALPSGITAEGLPLAIQLIGSWLTEANLLAAARWCEQILAFNAKPRACYAV
jgi:aspartyl-tRNA(Asn)/glutamyl-tRNA(Gln) amidotransferase subunit A